jgi:acyl carrier protein
MTDSRNERRRDPVDIPSIDRVATVLAEYVPVIPANRPLPEGLSLRQDLALDSLGLVSVLIRLGNDFGIDVGDQEFDLASLETVGDLVHLVEQLALATKNRNK